MRKWWLAGFAALVATALAGYAVICAMREEPSPWTSASPKALESFELGLDSLAKLYWSDAATHFARAVELDEDFDVAKLQLLLVDGGTPEERERWFRDLSEADLAPLQPRERFLIGYWRARFSGDGAEAATLLERYLEAAPEDPWAISTDCERSWVEEVWDEAEACYRRLIDMHPNWVQAQYRLGLIAMARARFEESEEHFRTYRFIAPDQAAPWDGLGQLLMTRGHYEKAAEAFEQALEIKDDYCFAVWHLAILHSMSRQFEQSERHLQRLEAMPACSDYRNWGMVCSRRAWNAYSGGDLEGARQVMDGACLERRGGFDFVAHRLALAAQDFDQARQLEGRLESRLEEKRESGDVYLFYENFLRATGKHLVAMRMWAQGAGGGSPSAACRLLAEADEALLYWGSDRAMFKLFNLRQLAACLEVAGKDQVAADVRANLDEVNPRYRAEYDVPEVAGTRVP